MDPNVQIAVVQGATAIAVAGIGLVTTRTLKRQKKRLDAVHEQVANSHETNLRDDLDRVIRVVEGVARDVTNLREDLETEREERRAMGAMLSRP